MHTHIFFTGYILYENRYLQTLTSAKQIHRLTSRSPAATSVNQCVCKRVSQVCRYFNKLDTTPGKAIDKTH